MAKVKAVTSRDNPLLVRLRKLAADPQGYRKLGHVWIEGDHLCQAFAQKRGQVPQAVIDEAAWEQPELRSLASCADEVVVVPQALMAQLRSVASAGYAVDMGEHAEDVRGVAAPVRDYTRAVIGALTVVGPAYRFQAERLEKELAPIAVRAARDLSSRLGFDLGARREAQG